MNDMYHDRDVRIAAKIWEKAALNPLTLNVLPGWHDMVWLPPIVRGEGPGDLINKREHEKILDMLRTDAIFRHKVADAMFENDKDPKKAFYRASVMEDYIRSYRTSPATWQRVLDKKTNRYYYWNKATNEVTWTAPT